MTSFQMMASFQVAKLCFGRIFFKKLFSEMMQPTTTSSISVFTKRMAVLFRFYVIEFCHHVLQARFHAQLSLPSGVFGEATEN